MKPDLLTRTSGHQHFGPSNEQWCITALRRGPQGAQDFVVEIERLPSVGIGSEPQKAGQRQQEAVLRPPSEQERGALRRGPQASPGKQMRGGGRPREERPGPLSSFPRSFTQRDPRKAERGRFLEFYPAAQNAHPTSSAPGGMQTTVLTPSGGRESSWSWSPEAELGVVLLLFS